MKRIKLYYLLILLILILPIFSGYHDKYILCQIIDSEYGAYHGIGKNIYEKLSDYGSSQPISREDKGYIFDYLNRLIYPDYSLDIISINEGRRAYFLGGLLQNELNAKGSFEDGDSYPDFYKLINCIQVELSNQENLTLDSRCLVALKELSSLIMEEYHMNVNIFTPKYMILRPYKRTREGAGEIYNMYYES